MRDGGGDGGGGAEATEAGAPESRERTLTVTVLNPLGFHARPAARLVRTAAGFDARIRVADVTNGRGPVSARSLNGVATLGARRGDELVLRANGREAAAALAALRRLATDGFGELDEASGVAGSAANAPFGPDRGAGSARGGDSEGPHGRAGCRHGARGTAGRAGGSGRTRAAPAPGDAGASRGSRGRSRDRVVGAGAGAGGHGGRDPRRAVGARRPRRRRGRGHLRRPPAVPRRRSPPRAGARSRLLARAARSTGLGGGGRSRRDPLGHPGGRRTSARGPRTCARWAIRSSQIWQRGVGGGEAGSGGGEADPSADATDAAEPAGGAAAAARPVPAPGILVAPDLSPADVAGLDPDAVAGVACAFGGPTSHAVILARALGLPAVVGAGAELLAVPEGMLLAVDGDAGTVTVAPSTSHWRRWSGGRSALAREVAAAGEAAAASAVTLDGVTVRVEANIAGPQDVPGAVAAGADGVGLLRTEFLFLGAAAMPDEDGQAAAYEAVAAALDGRPLTIRTLDAGADKPLPYLPLAAEANPFLGVRGLRLSLQHPEQLRRQFRALLRVAATRPLRVMLPMVSTAEEVERARELLAEARASLETRGVAVPARLELGIMVEVPAAALLADRLAPLVDFFSVGTNDLTQYAMAAERGNSAVAALADPLHPAVLRLIERAASAATAGRPVAVCGEVAGDRLAVPLLVGLGVRELSMSPSLIPAAKQAVRATDAARRRPPRAGGAGRGLRRRGAAPPCRRGADGADCRDRRSERREGAVR